MRFLVALLILTQASLVQARGNSLVNQVMQNSPGVSLADMQVDVLTSWENITRFEEGKSSIELQVIQGFNFEAGRIWQSLMQCYNNDLDHFRQDYLDKKIDCDGELQVEVKALHINVKNWLVTTDLGVDGSFFWDRLPVLPALHPLLGQIMIEAFAYNRGEATRISGYGRVLGGAQLWLSSFQLGCKVEDEPSRKCVKGMPFINGYLAAYNLIKSSAGSCLTSGFWPNASIFVFAETTIMSTGRSTHPSYQTRGGGRGGCWQGLGRWMPYIQVSTPTVSSLRQFNRMAGRFVGVYQELFEHYTKVGRR